MVENHSSVRHSNVIFSKIQNFETHPFLYFYKKMGSEIHVTISLLKKKRKKKFKLSFGYDKKEEII